MCYHETTLCSRKEDYLMHRINVNTRCQHVVLTPVSTPANRVEENNPKQPLDSLEMTPLTKASIL